MAFSGLSTNELFTASLHQEDVARLRALLAQHPEPRPPLVGPAADRSPKRVSRGAAQ